MIQMSRLEELIAELCPDGVEFKPIYDCVNRTENIKWNDCKNAEFQYIDLTSVDRDTHHITDTKTINADNAPSRAQQIVLSGDVLLGTTRPLLKRYCLIRDEFNYQICSTGFCVLRANERIALQKWIYYQVASTEFFAYVEKYQKGASYPAISDSEVKSYNIPIPPLPIQEEIVRILDAFTTLTAELEAELETRKKQYEYYRDELLVMTDNSPRKTLGEIAVDMYRGSGIKRDQVTEGGTPCVRYGEIYTTYKIWFDTCISFTRAEDIQNKKYFEHGDILFAITGESVDEISKSCVYIGHDKCLAGGDIVVMKHNENPKYIAYALSTSNAQMQKSKGRVKSKVVHSSVPALKSIEIPVPSAKEQARIVAILDRFDALTNDITHGLPAEIAARRKQYEYYRDKLLTFKEKVS